MSGNNLCANKYYNASITWNPLDSFTTRCLQHWACDNSCFSGLLLFNKFAGIVLSENGLVVTTSPCSAYFIWQIHNHISCMSLWVFYFLLFIFLTHVALKSVKPSELDWLKDSSTLTTQLRRWRLVATRDWWLIIKQKKRKLFRKWSESNVKISLTPCSWFRSDECKP